MLRCWYGVQSVPGNYTQHHYNPTTSKAGWIAYLTWFFTKFWFLLSKCCSRLIRPDYIFPVFGYVPANCRLNFLFHLREQHSLWSSAAEVHLLQESVYCAFKYGLLHSLAGLVAQSASCHDNTLKSHPPSHTFCIWHSHTNMRLMHQGKLGVQYFGQGYLA